MFNESGTFTVTVRDAYLTEAKFNKDDPYAFDVFLDLVTVDGSQSGGWQGECSERYGVGNAADKTQTEMTLATLEKVGWQQGQEITTETISDMIGLEFDVEVVGRKHSGRDYYDVKYLGSSKPKRLSREDADARAARLFAKTKPAKKKQHEDPFA